MPTILPIVTGKDTDILHRSTDRVKDPLQSDIQNLLPVMFDSLRAANGIGLAAPQIDQSIRLAVVEVENERLVLVNPKITSFSREKILFEEGCLSLPGQFFLIERSERITVRYQDETGKEKKRKATGLLAIVIQHEVDHLDGILIADRYERDKRKRRT
ncbi:MAG: peptide deformylase [Candidatus Moraniibacteriota bacterium]|nr:MAG: peptide deformylase [Candidatus Moranbacteria bacterium]